MQTKITTSKIMYGACAIITVVFVTAHYSALAQTNSLVAWGDNRWNQSNVLPGLTNVVDIAAGRNTPSAPLDAAAREEPDMFYVNKYLKLVEDELFTQP